MFGSIREYKVDSGVAINIVQRFQRDLIPSIRSLPEYVSFYVITKGAGTLVTVGIFESKEGANRANQFVQSTLENMGALVLALPDNLSGEAVIRIQR